MDPRRELTAATIVNSYSEEDLTRIFRDLGEEPAARRIASQLVKQRKAMPFQETMQLSKAIEKIVWRHGRRQGFWHDAGARAPGHFAQWRGLDGFLRGARWRRANRSSPYCEMTAASCTSS
jgi:16S rRNA C1402 N4-methylase RsmH